MSQTIGSYPGIVYVEEMQATNILGPFPGVATVRFLPQASGTISSGGTLLFGSGFEQAGWTNVVLDKGTMLRDERSGFVNEATFFDRREYWRRTIIDGIYNERDAEGELIEGREKTVPELAQLLLAAMGEGSYDISALPNVASDRPEVNWDCANPAIELEKLCNERGCSISLNHSSNSVVIVQIGSGVTLGYVSDAQSVEYGIDLGEVPQTLRLCGADVLWQARFLLEAVGIDTDGTIKPLADLSYKPVAGWDKVDPYTLAGADLTASEEELALKSVFRLYRVKAFADDSLDLPGTEITLDSIDQCFPLNRYLLEMSDNETEGRQRRALEIKGTFAARVNEGGLEEVVNLTDCAALNVRGYLVGETGLVQFQRPVYKLGSLNNTFEAATLYLETSFAVRDNTTHAYTKYTRDKAMSGTGVHAVRRPDYLRTLIASYSDCSTIDTVTDNLSTLNTAADAFLNEYATLFATRTSTLLKYRGIKPVNCDGLNRLVRWQVSVRRGQQGGAETVVTQNSEPLTGALRWRERMRLAQLDSARQEGSDRQAQQARLVAKTGAIR